jgi:4-hydroxybutyrate CoA-transferase
LESATLSGLSGLIQAGDRVWVAGSANEPTSLLEALRDDGVPAGVTFIQFPLAGFNQQDFTLYSADCAAETFFMTPHLKNADSARLAFVPMQMRAVFDYLASDVNVVLIQAARDQQGELRLGPNVDFARAALSGAKRVGLEINSSFTAAAGAPALAEVLDGAADFILESDRRLVELPVLEPDEAALAIGREVARLIADGDTLQTGIGAIPAAILAALVDHNDLGMHGGLIDDGGMTLIRAGNITSAAKSIDSGLHMTGMALGSHALHDWLADAPEVRFVGADYTHDFGVIRQLDNFVSINSAVEVDLYGQINAEVAGGRQISGTGGSVDFMRAAAASSGGRSIVAMNATARGGTVSRIVPRVDMVTALRTDVDMVVTEYGCARLKGASLAARKEALIEIAAPAFRDELRDAAKS